MASNCFGGKVGVSFLLLFSIVLFFCSVAVAEDQESVAMQQYIQGKAYLVAGQYAEAQQVFRGIIETWPDDEVSLRAIQQLAIVAIDDGNETSPSSVANVLYAEYGKKDKYEEAVYQIAKYYLKLNKPETARVFFQHIIDKYPESNCAFHSRRNMLRLYLNYKQIDEIETFLANRISQGGYRKVVKKVVEFFNELEKYDKSIILCELIIDKHPGSICAFECRKRLLLIYLKHKKSNEIETFLANCIPQKGFDSVVKEVIRDFNKLGNYQKSIELCQLIVDKHPGSICAFECRKGLVKAYMETGQTDKVASFLVNYGNRYGYENAVCQIAGHFIKSGKYDKSIELCQLIVDEFPKSQSASVCKHVILCLHLQFGLEGNIAAFLADNFSHKDLLFQLHLDFGSLENIKAHLSNHVGQDGYDKAFHAIGQHYMKLNFLAKASQFFALIIDEYPESRYALSSKKGMAEYYMRVQQDSQSESYLANHTDAVNVAKKIADVEVQVNEISMLVEAGDIDAARSLVDTIVDNNSEESFLVETLYRIADNCKESEHLALTTQIHELNYQKWKSFSQERQASKSGGEISDPNVLLLPVDKYGLLSILGVWEAQQDGNTKKEILDGAVADFKNVAGFGRSLMRIGEGYYSKGVNLQMSGNHDEMTGEYNKAITLLDIVIDNAKAGKISCPDISLSNAYWARGLCSYALENYEDTIKYFEPVLERSPVFKYRSAALFTVAQCYEILKTQNKVPISLANRKIKNAYEEILAKYPESNSAKTAKMWLDGCAVAQ